MWQSLTVLFHLFFVIPYSCPEALAIKASICITFDSPYNITTRVIRDDEWIS